MNAPSKSDVDYNRSVGKKNPARETKKAASPRMTLREKKRQAKGIIRKQTDKMGTKVKILRTSTGTVFTGIYWPAPANDVTIPITDAEVMAYTNELVKAIRNNQNCKEGENTSTFRNRWGTTAKYYTSDELEAIAREVVVSSSSNHFQHRILTGH
jgi:hypothetical protein